MLIVPAPTALPSWHAEHEPAFRPDRFAPFDESSPVVIYVLEHLEGAHNIETLADVRCRTCDDLGALEGRKPFPCNLGRLGIDLDADVAVVGCEPCPEAAQAGTDLQDRVNGKGIQPVPDEVVAVPAAERQRRQHSRIVVVSS